MFDPKTTPLTAAELLRHNEQAWRELWEGRQQAPSPIVQAMVDLLMPHLTQEPTPLYGKAKEPKA